MAYLTVEEKDEEDRATGRYLLAMVRGSLGPKLFDGHPLGKMMV